MTYEEALKDIIESGINLGAGDYVDPEALKVAAKALEKQIPKSIQECGHVISSNYDYCPECGQALKWEGDIRNKEV